MDEWGLYSPVAPGGVDTPGAAVQLTIDGWLAVAAAPDESPKIGDVTLRPGWRRIEIRVASPYGAPRRVSVGENSWPR